MCLYIAHCTLYIVHCTLYIVHFTLYTVNYTLYIVHCTLYTVHCTLYIIHCTLSDPLDLAELHSFRLVYFKHKEIFLVVCIVSDGSPVLSMPAY